MAYNRNWLSNNFCDIFELETGTKPNEDEKKCLNKLLDTTTESEGKELYYLAIYRLKRWYPKIIVYYFLLCSYKKYFKQNKAPHSLYLLSNKFAINTLNLAIKAYCRIND